MKYMHSEWRSRVDHWIEALKEDLYLPLGRIDLAAFFTAEHLPPEEAAKGDFQPILPGEKWGKPWEYCWMRGKITLPEAAAGKRVVMDLQTGWESTIYVNGLSFGTRRAEWVTVPHHYIVDNVLTACGVPGESYDLLIEAYGGHDFPEHKGYACATGPVLPGSYEGLNGPGPRNTLGDVTFGIWNEDAYQLYMDMMTLKLLAEQVDPESLRADSVATALEQATLIADFEQPPEARIESYKAAREALRPALQAVNGTTAPVFYAVGNAHLDLAWLWPMAETHRKTSRTFAQQLRLLEEYSEYKYIQSQPAAYEMCREYYPELFARIVKAAKKGQWIAEGAMWVEPDTNMTSGESLIRQVIHGKRYYKEVFGVDSVVLWLPDTFGYSAALPQILKGTGVKYLVTQKIFWSYNEGDRFPYHYFTWEGADGSKIDTFLPTSYTYQTDPKEICQTWKGRVQKRGLDSFLLPFGYGDGGGGPARDYIEYLLREKDLEGMPRVKMEGPVQFFEDMEAKGGPKNTYVGELYFSAHRGVYTSQAAIKKGNRRSELALREAEMWGALAAATARSFAYPLPRMDAAWKKLLLNQFHDILPGSSIAKVYEDARRDHRWIIGEAEAVKKDALNALTSGDGFSVFNSLSFPRTGLVKLPECFANGAVTSEGEPVPVQHTAEGLVGLVTVPPCGAMCLTPCGTASENEHTARAYLTETGAVIENDLVKAVLNSLGEVVSFTDQTGREYAAGPMNHLLAYKDVPRIFDAWDIDSNYIDQPVSLEEKAELTVKEASGLRAILHVSRKIMNSAWEQDIVLTAASERLDFVTTVDWRELHRLLKVEFPVNVTAAEGVNEIQFGYLARPNHRSRLYDKDRFEVCNQRYSALCDQSHGAAVLNDCKYGISMNGNALQLSLLRAAASPEMRADNGVHTFTYAFTGWNGSFLDSPVVREAYDLNVPLQTAESGCAPFSAFSVDASNVFIDTVKPAEDGSGDVILRLYEAKRGDTACHLAVNIPIQAAYLCDMLENRLEARPVTDGKIVLHFHPFEVKTIRFTPASL
ncbi:MAG: alpha-mannosidase [Clostridia bacterium]|nr:alpha-mannosidase [Clostridia bacterium]